MIKEPEHQPDQEFTPPPKAPHRPPRQQSQRANFWAGIGVLAVTALAAWGVFKLAAWLWTDGNGHGLRDIVDSPIERGAIYIAIAIIWAASIAKPRR